MINCEVAHQLVISSIFCQRASPMALWKVCQRPQQERDGALFCPGDEAVVERLKTKASQPRDDGENPVHSVHSPYVKMNESMLEIVLFL